MTNYYGIPAMVGTAAASESDFSLRDDVDLHVDDPERARIHASLETKSVFATLNKFSAVGESWIAFATDQLSAAGLLDLCRSLRTSRAFPAAETGQFAGPMADNWSSLRGER